MQPRAQGLHLDRVLYLSEGGTPCLRQHPHRRSHFRSCPFAPLLEHLLTFTQSRLRRPQGRRYICRLLRRTKVGSSEIVPSYATEGAAEDEETPPRLLPLARTDPTTRRSK